MYKDPIQRAEHSRRKKKANRARKKAFVREMKSGPCSDCGHTYPYYVMQFDHRDPSQKAAALSEIAGHNLAWARIRAEIEKCDVVCANCHAIRTHEQKERGLRKTAPPINLQIRFWN